MLEYFAFGRVKNCTMIFLSPNYHNMEIFLRKQMHYLIIIGICCEREIKSIVKEHELGSALINEDLLEAMFSKIKESDADEERNFMKIDLRKCPINKKVSRNFTDYMQIAEKQ
jgi:hypothetical protein